jgi:phosphatidylserine/phosphatidylglycerophosphate/cardiolipin synthase-like enzyme
MEHAQVLAQTARWYKEQGHLDSLSPLGALYQALSEARMFVHFTTYGLDYEMIGALKMVGQRVPVRGIVSGVDANTSELTNSTDEATWLELKLYDSVRMNSRNGYQRMPHQKLVLIDGLLAFKGSANLRAQAWRKAADSLEVVEVVTDVDEVVNLNNRYFAPIWAGFSEIGDAIQMM